MHEFFVRKKHSSIAPPWAWREGSEQFAGTVCPAAASDRIYKIEGKCCSLPQAVCGHAYEEGAGGGTGRDPRETIDRSEVEAP